MIQTLTPTYQQELLFQAGRGPAFSRDLPMLSLKTKQVALGFFAGFFFTSAFLSLAALGTGLITAIPAVALGITCIWLISRVKAYRDPIAMKSYQEAALTQSLIKTVKEHGWKNMIQYELPSRDAFPRLFLDAMNDLTIKEAVAFWQEANQAQEGVTTSFFVPSAEIFKEKWKTETRGMAVTEVINAYEVRKYIQLGFAHPKLEEAIRLYENVLQQFSLSLLSFSGLEEQIKLINEHYERYLSIDVECSANPQ